MNDAWANSTTGRLVRRLDRGAERAARGSRVLAALDRVGDTLGRWIRGSWLLAPPEREPEVVVIDLRETYTVGPVVAALDRVVSWAAPRWRGSTPRRALARAGRAVADRPVRLASVLVLAATTAVLALRGGTTGTPNGAAFLLAALAIAGTRETRSVEELRETRVGGAVEALLVPPESPDERR